MSKKILVGAAATALAASAVLVGTPASAVVPGPITVDFTGETTGVKLEPYSTAAAPDVRFYDTIGADLAVGDFPFGQSHGLAISVGHPDGSALEMRLTNPSNSIRLSFGNDDPSHPPVVDRTDQAELTVYRGGAKVGEEQVNLNANDRMDQSISYDGPAVFNRAIFRYVNGAGEPLNVSEIVDDIVVGPLCTVTGTAGHNNLGGTGGSDVICGAGGDDTIRARGGDDLVYGGSGRDNLLGGRGGDVLRGGPGKDSCNGGRGTDTGQSCEVKKSIP